MPDELKSHQLRDNEFSDRLIRIALGILIFFHLFAIIYHPYLNIDVAQYLTAGQMLIHGAVPYVDIVDTNPPIIIYLSAIPALFSKLFHIPLIFSGLFFFFTLIIGTMLLFGKMLKKALPEITRAQKHFLYICWIYGSLWIYQHNYYGQREQLIFIFLAPFILLRYARYRDVEIERKDAITSAILAFLAIAMKPFFLLLIVIVEVQHILVFRKIRKPILATEIYTACIAGFIFIIHFFLIPGMSSFYSYWLGFIARGYPAYDIGISKTIEEALKEPAVHLYILIAIILTILFYRPKRKELPLSSLFGSMAIMSLLIYILQARGYPYHMVPFLYSLLFGIAFLVLQSRHIFAHDTKNYFKKFITTLAIIIAIISVEKPYEMLIKPLARAPFSVPKGPFALMIEKMTEPSDRVLFLNTNVFPAFPGLTYSQRMHGGRFLCTYPIAFFYKNSTDYKLDKKWNADEERFYQSLVDDIKKNKPKLIFINSLGNMQATAPYFTIREYLKRRNFYTTFLVRYRFVANILGFELYERRKKTK